MKKALGVAAVLALLVLFVLLWRTTRVPAPESSSPATAQSTPTTAPAPPALGSCDSQPRPPKLPDTLAPASADMAGILRALDAGLTDQHKAWLRCFTLDDELLARTHQGFGRWLRTKLRLWQQPSLLAALGAKTPDDASTIIILVYTSHLRGEDLSVSAAAARRIRALADAGVTP